MSDKSSGADYVTAVVEEIGDEEAPEVVWRGFPPESSSFGELSNVPPDGLVGKSVAGFDDTILEDLVEQRPGTGPAETDPLVEVDLDDPVDEGSTVSAALDARQVQARRFVGDMFVVDVDEFTSACAGAGQQGQHRTVSGCFGFVGLAVGCDEHLGEFAAK